MKLFVANWKMNLSLSEELSYGNNNLESLKAIDNKVIIAPSFPALAPLAKIFHETDVAIAAQTCSEFEKGSYTGQVSAKTAAQSGCSYIIVGHSEERSLGISNEQIAKKALRTLEAGLIPIICIGESKQAYNNKATKKSLLIQLQVIKESIKTAPAYIAYEPLWAIGSGETPTTDELNILFSWLKEQMPGCAFLYGGSVDENNIKEMSSLNNVSGFLIGKASIDFQQFKKIVSY